MPDTTEPRRALNHARRYHREVMGGMSTAELKLMAAGGALSPAEVIKPDDPEWMKQSAHSLTLALVACDSLRAALVIAKEQVEALVAFLPDEGPFTPMYKGDPRGGGQ